MTKEEKESIENIKRILENANPFTMPLHIYNSLTTVLNLIQNLQEENKKKDKVIDLMANIIFEHRNDFEWWEVGTDIDNINQQKQYFEKKASDIDE